MQTSIEKAKEDGIRHENGSFYIPCTICNEDVQSFSYSRNRMYICKECRKIILSLRRKHKKGLVDDQRTVHERRFDNAVENLRKQGIDKSWDSAIKIAMKKIDCYDSIPEAMMAIGLIHYKYAIIPQQKIGSLTVDFALPRNKMVVEVDGSLYHKEKYKENHRDYRIRNDLGMDWEVRHVPAEEILKDINHAIDFFVNLQKQPYSGDNNLY